MNVHFMYSLLTGATAPWPSASGGWRHPAFPRAQQHVRYKQDRYKQHLPGMDIVFFLCGKFDSDTEEIIIKLIFHWKFDLCLLMHGYCSNPDNMQLYRLLIYCALHCVCLRTSRCLCCTGWRQHASWSLINCAWCSTCTPSRSTIAISPSSLTTWYDRSLVVECLGRVCMLLIFLVWKWVWFQLIVFSSLVWKAPNSIVYMCYIAIALSILE